MGLTIDRDWNLWCGGGAVLLAWMYVCLWMRVQIMGEGSLFMQLCGMRVPTCMHIQHLTGSIDYCSFGCISFRITLPC